MKGLILLPLLLLTACGINRTNVIEYQQVIVAPAPVYEPFITIEDEPVDVTMTRLEYY